MTVKDSSSVPEFQFRIIFYFLVLLTTVVWLIHRRQKFLRVYRLGNFIPGPTPVPIFGNTLLAFGKKPEHLMKVALDFCDRYGTVIRGWLGYNLYIFLMDPVDIEVILNSHVHIHKSAEYRFFKPWLGDGLLISAGEKWRSHRKIIAPTFHINILKSFINIFYQNSKNVVEKMKLEVGKTFDVHDYMSTVTVDILLETAMGITRKEQDNSGLDYAMAVMKMCDIIHQRHYKFWLRFDSIFKITPFFKKQLELLNIIHGLTNKVIKSKKETFLQNKAKGYTPQTIEELTRDVNDNVPANNEKTVSESVFKGYRDDLDFNDENDVGLKKRLAFLDLMIETAQNETNQISDLEIKEEVDTIMFEGHDTTAAASSFVLCLLGVHQDIQTRVYDELYTIFGDSDRPVTFEDTLRMKYLEMVILETLRMYPPVPVIARKLKKDVYNIGTNNYVLPAGATVVLCMYKVHRSEKHYKDPEVFNPDNFLPENMAKRHYYSYIPFSAGPRSCVGRKYALLKLKVLLATVLRNYRSISDIKEKDFHLQGDIILKRTDGFKIKLEHRIRKPSCL